MKILFVVGHPAHVHLFKNVVRLLVQHGHTVQVGAVAREVTSSLLAAYGIPYFVFGTSQPDLISKALGTAPKEFSLLRHARAFSPDLLVSTGSPYAAHVSALLDRPHIAFGDTEHATLITRFMLPFTDAVCTPDVFGGDLGRKHIRYRGYKELAYVHPKYFQPNPAVLNLAGLSLSEPYVLMRFASWDASHDLGDHGFRFGSPREGLEFLMDVERLGRVVVTTDRRIPRGLEPYVLHIPAEHMHHILAFAHAYFGEGATMAAEAGVLGVPWVFVSSHGRSFLADQQTRYGLGFWVRDLAGARRLISELSAKGIREQWKMKRDRMLRDKEDVVEFITEFIEEWPDSYNIRKGGG